RGGRDPGGEEHRPQEAGYLPGHRSVPAPASSVRYAAGWFLPDNSKNPNLGELSPSQSVFLRGAFVATNIPRATAASSVSRS
ncbi:MAG: hypothetical protein ACRD1T_26935, partial [Acidimicrobiia bacterium]